jgi:ABC-type nitrate/sulfonate/bicarbonate transport system substrate-binding protein
MPPSIDRRTLLVRGLQASGLVLAVPLLEACGSSSSSGAATATSAAAAATSAAAAAATSAAATSAAAATSGAASAAATSAAATSAAATSAAAATTGAATTVAPGTYGTIDYRLAWIKNVEFAGTYIADTKGYYKDEGFSKVNLIAGGPTAPPIETDVVTKKAFVGLSAPDLVAAAVKAGAKIKIIGAQYQQNPFAIMSMTKTAIKTPQDMIGKKIGVQAANTSVWNAFLKANKIDPGKITVVPVQFDPLPLTTGTVDGWFSFITNEPNDLRDKGFDVTTFLLADNNYPLVSETYVVLTENITAQAAKIKAMFRAEIKGWKASVANPETGAALAATVYGKGLGLTTKEQTEESTDQNKLIANADTAKNGLFTITPALIAQNIATLKFAGFDMTAEQLFDTSLIDAVYKEDPTLI